MNVLARDKVVVVQQDHQRLGGAEGIDERGQRAVDECHVWCPKLGEERIIDPGLHLCQRGDQAGPEANRVVVALVDL